MTQPDIQAMTCKNGCDLTYEVDGKKYSRIVFHKMLNNGVGDHWDCPKCGAGCGRKWEQNG